MTKEGRIYTPRGAFWSFCVRASVRSRHDKKEEIRGNLSPYDIDKLFVDQGWRCAVTGIKFDAPSGCRLPFGPSIDRIIPGGKYVVGNVRIVCTIVNFAMNEWGEATLRELVARMATAGVQTGDGASKGKFINEFNVYPAPPPRGGRTF